MEYYRISRQSISYILCFLAFLCINSSICLGQDTRSPLLDTAKSYVGVRELTGRNDGEEVERFLRMVGFGPGYAWCGAFVSYLYEVNGLENPKSAWSPNWGLDQDAIWQKGWNVRIALTRIKPGDIFTIYYESKGRIGHVGMVYYANANYLYTIEGNTNSEGSREGDGVYIKKRKWSQIYRITRYIW